VSGVEGQAVSGETGTPARPSARPTSDPAADPAAPPDAEEQELTGSEPAPVSEPPRVLVPRWIQLVLLPIALLGAWALARAAGKVFLIFIVAALIALILNPAVAFLQRSRLPRGVAVFAVYLGFFLTVGGVGVLLANPISNQVQAFAQEVPHLAKDGNKKILEFQNYLNRHGLHARLVPQGKTALQTLQEKLLKGSSSVVSFGGNLLGQAATASFDLVLVFVMSVYLLIYGEKIGELARRVMPNGNGTPADDYPVLVQRAVSHYVQGQLLFSLIMGTTAGLSLYIFGLLGVFPQGSKYAIVFGLFFGLMELIPYVGPILGAAPPILVALFTDPIVAVWVTLLFVGLQQLEGHVVAPQIFGHSLRINPLLVILALLLGEQLYGLVGALVALPILSILRETVVYLGRHLELEQWDRSPGGML
jgi:predicted PurR-regulated permease PerM